MNRFITSHRTPIVLFVLAQLSNHCNDILLVEKLQVHDCSRSGKCKLGHCHDMFPFPPREKAGIVDYKTKENGDNLDGVSALCTVARTLNAFAVMPPVSITMVSHTVSQTACTANFLPLTP